MNKKKRIMHVDMDAFFASIEQRDQPLLKGKPVIVGGEPGGRGVAATCSYEARKFGVKSGMPIALAVKKCPDGTFIRTNGKKYMYASMRVIEILNRYSPKVEPTSIDEAYLDITGSVKDREDERKIGESLKREIRRELELTCSVGIASNRVFAKIATNMKKPDGLTIIADEKLEKKIYPLTISELIGIGKKSEGILKSMGIKTIGDLGVYPENELERVLGVNGPLLSKLARGEGSDRVLAFDEEEEVKSIGNEHTLERDTCDENIINMLLLKLSEKVGRRLRESGFAGRTVAVKFRYSDFSTFSKRCTYPFLVWEDNKIYSISKKLFYSVYKRTKKIRLLGITVSGVVKSYLNNNNNKIQTELFTNCHKSGKLLNTIDLLKDIYGEMAIARAAYLKIL